MPASAVRFAIRRTGRELQAGTLAASGWLNFDVNVVGSNGGYPISYNRGHSTCTLTCHQAVHNPDGSVTMAAGNLNAK
jgi:hypothetical protein